MTSVGSVTRRYSYVLLICIFMHICCMCFITVGTMFIQSSTSFRLAQWYLFDLYNAFLEPMMPRVVNLYTSKEILWTLFAFDILHVYTYLYSYVHYTHLLIRNKFQKFWLCGFLRCMVTTQFQRFEVCAQLLHRASSRKS